MGYEYNVGDLKYVSNAGGAIDPALQQRQQ